MDPTELKLAELVRQHPNLYDQSQRDYKDNLRGHLSWREIAGIMEISEGEVRMIWRNLRDKFCKAKKRLAKRNFLHLEDSAGNPVMKKPIPKLYCQMAWLSAYVRPRTEKSRKYVKKVWVFHANTWTSLAFLHLFNFHTCWKVEKANVNIHYYFNYLTIFKVTVLRAKFRGHRRRLLFRF